MTMMSSVTLYIVCFIGLCDFQVKDIWEYDVPDKLDQLSIYKDKGNDYYKVGEILCTYSRFFP